MKKVLSFFRSMKFGLILLGLIALISIAGSVIPQGEEAMYYVRNYSWYGILLKLQLNHVFTSRTPLYQSCHVFSAQVAPH